MKKVLDYGVPLALIGVMLAIVVIDPLWLHHPVTVVISIIAAIVAWAFVLQDLLSSRKEHHITSFTETQIGEPSDEAGVEQRRF